jgi:hypothetical protein
LVGDQLTAEIKTLIEEEKEHVLNVRNEIYCIMHNLLFMDLTGYSVLQAQGAILRATSGCYGQDTARIAADRVIDCLMWL